MNIRVTCPICSFKLRVPIDGSAPEQNDTVLIPMKDLHKTRAASALYNICEKIAFLNACGDGCILSDIKIEKELLRALESADGKTQ